MIALLAGTGDLPGAIVTRLRGQGRQVVACVLKDNPADLPDGTPVLNYRLETFGTLLNQLQERGVTEVCLAGAINRPEVDPAAIDAATLPLVPQFMAALGKGDDGALRVVLSILESSGFAVRAAHEILPEFLPPAGVLTRATPNQSYQADAGVGEATVARMGASDTGQACVIRAGQIIATEGPDGTDAMLTQLHQATDAGQPLFGDPIDWAMDAAGDVLGAAADWLTGDNGAPPRPETPAKGGILFKAPKPDQDRRADLPVIGPGTAENAAAAGLAGIVIEEGGVMVLNAEQIVDMLDAQGLFLWVRPKGGQS